MCAPVLKYMCSGVRSVYKPPETGASRNVTPDFLATFDMSMDVCGSVVEESMNSAPLSEDLRVHTYVGVRVGSNGNKNFLQDNHQQILHLQTTLSTFMKCRDMSRENDKIIIKINMDLYE